EPPAANSTGTAGSAALAENLRAVQEKIRQAEKSAGRPSGAVQLIAVSKTKSIEMINAVAAAGQTCFGENYVQEALPKIAARPDLQWHFIGRLQTNKVKSLVGQVALIHSVDRLKLAEEISRQALKQGCVQDILIEVHLGAEASKGGVGLTGLS